MFSVLCTSQFPTQDTRHVQEHFEEIKAIDIEYLKSGHEIFDCSSCHIESNNPVAIKNHIAEHVLQPKQKAKIKSNTRKHKKAMGALDGQGVARIVLK